MLCLFSPSFKHKQTEYSFDTFFDSVRSISMPALALSVQTFDGRVRHLGDQNLVAGLLVVLLLILIDQGGLRLANDALDLGPQARFLRNA